MDKAFETQYAIKKNAEQLQDMLKELEQWENDMKVKDLEVKSQNKQESEKHMQPPRNVKKLQEASKGAIKRSVSKNENDVNNVESGVNKIQKNDESATIKTDLTLSSTDTNSESVKSINEEAKVTEQDLTCKTNDNINQNVDLDTNETSKNSQNGLKALTNIDQAFFEKELGNKLVKQGQWQEASNCYTTSIKLDPKNPIYYANRALCHLKLKRFKEAEVDSTVAIQLDKSYVKAYQRRGFARKALKQYREAIADYEQVLLLQPTNSDAQKEIEAINAVLLQITVQKSTPPLFNPKNIFQNPVKEKKEKANGANVIVECENISKKIESSIPFESEVPEGFEIIEPVTKPPHLRSNKPLQKIKIKEVTVSKKIEDQCPLIINSQQLTTLPLLTDFKNIVSQKPQTKVLPITEKTVPETYAQFLRIWEELKNDHKSAFNFLKILPVKQLPNIFSIRLDSNTFSELLTTLASPPSLEDTDFLTSFLKYLAQVPRFQSIMLFSTEEDRHRIENCLSKIENESDLAELRKCYKI